METNIGKHVDFTGASSRNNTPPSYKILKGLKDSSGHSYTHTQIALKTARFSSIEPAGCVRFREGNFLRICPQYQLRWNLDLQAKKMPMIIHKMQILKKKKSWEIPLPYWNSVFQNLYSTSAEPSRCSCGRGSLQDPKVPNESKWLPVKLSPRNARKLAIKKNKDYIVWKKGEQNSNFHLKLSSENGGIFVPTLTTSEFLSLSSPGPFIPLM